MTIPHWINGKRTPGTEGSFEGAYDLLAGLVGGQGDVEHQDRDRQ
ncbi:hypothetical protein ACTWPT_53070 [Nonomuraea sp. 3N208]